MTNEYIEVVKRWRAGEAISLEELRANSVDARANARAAADAVDAAYAAAAAAAYAAYAADAVDAAYDAAADEDHYGAGYWVKRYEELTNDK